MESEYGQMYARLYHEHWWWRAREEFLMTAIGQLELPEQPSVFDIGCGDGLFFKRLSQLGGTVEGLEADATLISSTNPQREQIHCGPFDDTFRPARRYSLVTMLDVLEHLPKPAEAMRKAASMLEPEGKLVVTVPAFLSLWTSHDEINHHFTRYTKPTLMPLVMEARLEVLRLQYFFHWLVPLKIITRWKEKVLPSKRALPQVPASLGNLLFFTISRWEQRICSRIALPMGSSLLLIAQPADKSGHNHPH
jgi:trans-aconitate methyltransferase